MSYLKTAIRGVSWVAAFRISTRFLAFLRTIILARILAPADFGLFGIATLVLAFLEIITETGINVVLIQKKEKIDEYIDNAWVVSIGRGLVISLIMIASAGAISGFFKSPDSYLLLILISLVAFIRGFINPAIVKFQKDLQFNKEFWFRFAVFSVDTLVATSISIITRSAIGLIIGLIVGAAFELILSFIYAKPTPRFNFNKSKTKEILSKGKWLTGAGIFQFLFRQGDDAVVGRILGESSLGVYQVAYKVSTLPISEVTDVFGRVVFPLYVKMSDDLPRLKKAFIKTSGLIALLATVLGVGIFIFAPLIVTFLLGDKWAEAIPVLRVLSVFGVIQSITNSGYSLLLALEKNKTVVTLTFISIVGLFSSIIPLVTKFGVIGAGFAALFGAVLSLPFMTIAVTKALNNKNSRV